MGAKIYSSTMVQCRMAVWEAICRLGSVDMWSYDEGMENERYLHPLMYLGDDQFLIDTEEEG